MNARISPSQIASRPLARFFCVSLLRNSCASPARLCCCFPARLFFAALLLFLAIPSARAQETQPPQPQQQPSPLDALAFQIARELSESNKAEFQGTKILVFDFADASGSVTELGVQLADEFTVSLRKYAQGFIVIDRSDYHRAATQDRLAHDTLADLNAAKCYSTELGADFAIGGAIVANADSVDLTVRATRISGRRELFEKKITLLLTPEMQVLLSKPVSLPAVSSDKEENSWVNREHPPLEESAVATVSKSGDGGYTLPECVYCAHGDYTDMAVKGRVEGTVELKVQIDAEGFPSKISLTRGVPCGLNQKAIEAVEHWRFKPAIGPDGKPAAAIIPVEVTFRLY